MLQQIDLTTLPVAPAMHWVEAFGSWLHKNDKAANTISAYLQDIRHFGDFFRTTNGQDFTPSMLNASDVKTYFSKLDADKSVAPRTRNRRLASLRVLVRFAVETGMLEYDPTISIKREKVKAIPRDRTREEIHAINQVVDAGSHLRCSTNRHALLGRRDRMIYILGKNVGLRESEIKDADIEDVDFANGKIYVMGKGSKKDYVDVSRETLEEVASWLELRPVGKSQALITDEFGNRITRTTVWRRIKLMGSAAKVANLRPHDLRHTFAFAVAHSFLGQGLSQLAATNGVQHQLRHGDSKTSLNYFGVSESQIRSAMEALYG